eukprot:Em0024g406a
MPCVVAGWQPQGRQGLTHLRHEFRFQERLRIAHPEERAGGCAPDGHVCKARVDRADGVASFANKHVGSLAKLVAFRHVKMDLQLRGLGRVVKRDVPPSHQSPARCLCGQKELAQTEKAKVAEGGTSPSTVASSRVSARGPCSGASCVRGLPGSGAGGSPSSCHGKRGLGGSLPEFCLALAWLHVREDLGTPRLCVCL